MSDDLSAWYPRSDSHTPDSLLSEYRGQTGLWVVHSVPSRDELGTSRVLAVMDGAFEAALATARRLVGFLDEGMCGDIRPLVPMVVM